MIPLTDVAQLNSITQSSELSPVAIFKHSTRCSISSMALNRIERDWKKHNPSIPIYYLDLIRFRNISNLIADIFKVQHESPQLLIIRNGVCVYHASHNAIDAADISGVIESV